ncbi:NAD+ synthase [Sessilibacter corallicola]|uniref:NAD+ synthase n=1 Tax=Sessilibacter corallicola TaxID=2904075 RepID=UPI001E48F315|nr:NAD+ synthase [Sessilibacter corallicola]
MAGLNVVMAQLNFMVGDIPGNLEKVISVLEQSAEKGADVVVFPELTLIGYPPEDLLLRPSLETRIDNALNDLKSRMPADIAAVVGYPKVVDGNVFNMAGVFLNGNTVTEYAKQCLPNYQVFDEKRYFTAGHSPCVFELSGIKVGVTVCEDIWLPEPTEQARLAGAEIMLNLNASPFHRGKNYERDELLGQRANEGQMPIVYVNLVGGQDELVFDGGSMVVDAKGEKQFQAPFFEEGLYQVNVELGDDCATITPNQLIEPPSELASIYQALVLGVRDYVNKNGFKGVVLGLSGGIDSALTLAVAVDALGKDRVEAIMMPFRYTSDLSKNDAADEAERLGVRYQSISIEPIFDAFMASLAEEFEGTERDTTEENLQARARGVLLMAISNKKRYLVLTTGNKSEMAVGYSTLYGDMAGGYDVLKDVPKVTVFELSRYRNTISEVIPVSVIERPPSAELAPDQKDEDSLPPYEVLDEILYRYIELDESAEVIIAAGFESQTVNRVLRLVDINEYKRRQAPEGVRITQRGFGRDRRYPITNGWKIGD